MPARLVVEIDDDLVVVLVFKERLVGSNHLGIFLEPCPNTLAEVNDAFHTFRGQEGVTENLLGLSGRYDQHVQRVE